MRIACTGPSEEDSSAPAAKGMAVNTARLNTVTRRLMSFILEFAQQLPAFPATPSRNCTTGAAWRPVRVSLCSPAVHPLLPGVLQQLGSCLDEFGRWS